MEEDDKKNNKKDPLIIDEEDSYGKSEDADGIGEKITVNANTMGNYLNTRKEMIQDFKKISSQVNDLSKSVMIELQNQGKHVDKLQDQATKINENAKNVKNETDETNDINEKNIRKTIWIIVVLVIVVFVLVAIFRML